MRCRWGHRLSAHLKSIRKVGEGKRGSISRINKRSFASSKKCYETARTQVDRGRSNRHRRDIVNLSPLATNKTLGGGATIQMKIDTSKSIFKIGETQKQQDAVGFHGLWAMYSRKKRRKQRGCYISLPLLLISCPEH